jgi:hypothetical protein
MSSIRTVAGAKAAADSASTKPLDELLLHERRSTVMPNGYFQTSLKKGRGRAQRSRDLIETMYRVAEPAQPITGRGVGYKLFSAGLISSTSKNDMQTVY